MAGEIEEPFRLNFQGADSLHSGSISFGRFESEAALCWERRSSFSHNRYLEDVEKCSKPGLVIEKKAYFEAHFRKKGSFSHTSPPSSKKEYQKSENDISEKTRFEEIGHTNGENRSSCSNESRDSSVYERENDVANYEVEKFGTLISDPKIELVCDDGNEAKIVEAQKEDYAKHGDSLPLNSISESVMQEKLDCESRNFHTIDLPEIAVGTFLDSLETEANGSSIQKHHQGSCSKEKVEPEAEYMKPGLMPHISVAQSKRRISSKEFIGLQKKTIEKVNNVRRFKTETRTSESAAQIKGLMHKIPEYEPVSKAKGVHVIKSGGKEIRNRRAVYSQSSTVQKVSTSVHQSANRVKPAIGATKPSTKQDQFHTKIQEKKSENKQLKKSLDFKATSLPSFYHRTLRDSDRNKDSATSVKPRKLRTNASPIETKVSKKSAINSEERAKKIIIEIETPNSVDPSSCHSTVTSESIPSSPIAETINIHRSQAGHNNLVSMKKQNKEKHMSFNKHEEATGNKLYNGKTVDGEQKMRTGRSTTHTAFKK